MQYCDYFFNNYVFFVHQIRLIDFLRVEEQARETMTCIAVLITAKRNECNKSAYVAI